MGWKGILGTALHTTLDVAELCDAGQADRSTTEAAVRIVVVCSGWRYHSVRDGDANPRTATDSKQWWKPQTKENSSYLAPKTVYLLQAFFYLFQLRLPTQISSIPLLIIPSAENGTLKDRSKRA